MSPFPRRNYLLNGLLKDDEKYGTTHSPAMTQFVLCELKPELPKLRRDLEKTHKLSTHTGWTSYSPALAISWILDDGLFVPKPTATSMV